MLVLLRQVLLAVLGNSDLTRQILNALGLPAQADNLASATQLIQENHDILRDPDVGLDAIATIVEAINTNLTAGVTAIEAAIALTQQAGDPVTLPDAPPGYGGGGGGGIGASDVWEYVFPSTGVTAGFIQESLPLYAEVERDTYLKPYWKAPDFWLVAIGPFGVAPSPTTIPSVDWSTLLSTDDAVAFLDRNFATFTWEAWPTAPDYTYGTITEDGQAYAWVFRYNPAEFGILSHSSVANPLVGAPLWPGVDLVTMGEPVDLAATVDLAGPMDGVLVSLATTPPDKPHYTLGDVTATAHIGQVSFQSVEGHMEYPQQLSFADHVYVPHSMTLAGACKVRCVPGVTGTITPWTLL